MMDGCLILRSLNQSTAVNNIAISFQILHTHIAAVIKLPISTTGSPLLIRCKNFLSVTFVIPRERESHDIYTSLLKLSQPSMIFS